MIRTQIQLTEEQFKALQELSAARRLSMAELIRQSVDSYLADSGRSNQEERRQRALSVIGKYRSGKTDISERHDDYVAEAYGCGQDN